jgi:hypothetical protein
MSVNVQIVDNFLDANNFGAIKNLLTGSDFPWYAGTKLSPDVFNASSAPNIQFCHHFYRDFNATSHHISVLSPAIDKINPMALVRIKANLTVASNCIEPFGFHKDYLGTNGSKDYPDMRVGILFLSNTDGKTIFETGEEITNIENRYIEFDNSLSHSGTTHTFPEGRYLINFNFFS